VWAVNLDEFTHILGDINPDCQKDASLLCVCSWKIFPTLTASQRMPHSLFLNPQTILTFKTHLKIKYYYLDRKYQKPLQEKVQQCKSVSIAIHFFLNPIFII